MFLHATTWEGMIFGKINNIIKPESILYKPVYACPICMTPWWGTIIYLLFFHISFIDWVLTIGCAGGFSTLSLAILSLMNK